MAPSTSNALLGMLHPAWQALIAACLLVVTLLGLRRLLQRGPAQMTNAMVIIGLLIVAVTAAGLLAVSCSDPRTTSDGSTQPARVP